MHRSQIPIPMSCGESWGNMQGDERQRFCVSCQHHVVNLSRLTELEARGILRAAATERICARYSFDAEGKILFRPPPRENAAGLKSHLVAGAVAAGALLTGCASVTTNSTPELVRPVEPVILPPCPALPNDTTAATSAPIAGEASSGSLAGVVLDAKTCRPIADVVVSVISSKLQSGEALVVTRTDGTFVVPNLPPGDDYTVQFDCSIYRPESRKGISVQSGQVARMQVSMVEEEMVTMGLIEIVPSVDTNSSTQGIHADKDMIRRLPLVR